MEPSIFTKIIRRELPAEILYEDEEFIVLLNRFPMIEGETLIITKIQTPYLFDLPDDLYARFMALTKRIAKALDATYDIERTCLVVEGFEVPHVHARLYPVRDGHLDLRSGPAQSDEELRRVGEKIRRNI